jgi:photosystem II stability/assembly factor-like uncharacterized protein
VASGVVVLVALALLVGGRDDNAPGTGTSGAVVGGDLHSLVVDPANPQRLLVGGHQAVSDSSDGGRTWRRIPSLDDADAMGWAFAKDAIWVSGHPGLSRSTDAGRSFSRANQGLPDTDVHAFGAGLNILYGASTGAGVFASTDGGRSWQVRSGEAGPAFFGRMVVDPANPEHVLAADVRAGVVESSDGARTWRRLGGSPPAAWLSRASDGTILASGGPGAARSSDGGRSWQPLGLPDGATLVEASPASGALYAAANQGNAARIWVSQDGGKTWTDP